VAARTRERGRARVNLAPTLYEAACQAFGESIVVLSPHPRAVALAFLCLFIGTKNGVDGRSADGALTFECWFTILHGDSLRVLHLSLCFAFDTVILIGHGEVASLHCSKTLKNTYDPICGMYGTRQVHFISLCLQ
jgi:hypothetical protein